MKRLICIIIAMYMCVLSVYASNNTVYSQTDYTAFIIKDGYELELYEPEDGCYAGAYVLANKSINYDMEQFDMLTEKTHNSYVYNMRLDAPFPTMWVLECISNQKTPFIIVNPPNSSVLSSEILLEKLAESFGEFYVPMFINFYPDPESLNIKSADYIRFFRKAREIFSRYASNVSFVWSVSIDNVFGNEKYYPGDTYVNWVGINIFMPIFKNGKKNNTDIYKRLDFFYNSYQFKKPIAISGFASSHFSTFDHKYYVPQSVNEITLFYSSIKSKYPRIKLVNYIDFNNVSLAGDKTVTDNFSVTEDKNVFDAYKKAVKSDYFLSDLSVMESGDIVTQMYTSAFSIYNDGVDLYVNKKLIKYELQINIPEKAKSFEVNIDGVVYYRVTDLKTVFGLTANIDRTEKKLYISSK